MLALYTAPTTLLDHHYLNPMLIPTADVRLLVRLFS